MPVIPYREPAHERPWLSFGKQMWLGVAGFVASGAYWIVVGVLAGQFWEIDEWIGSVGLLVFVLALAATTRFLIRRRIFGGFVAGCAIALGVAGLLLGVTCAVIIANL